MTRRIYKPGEVDDDAYGPAPRARPLPKWSPEPGEEQEAFKQWCLAMLAEVSSEEELEEAMRELQADNEAEDMLRDLVEEPLFKQARELMPLLTREAFRRYRHGPEQQTPAKPNKRGAKADVKIAEARLDNARLTVLFKRHFEGNYRRPSAPSRMEILSARHELSTGQKITLENYLTKWK